MREKPTPSCITLLRPYFCVPSSQPPKTSLRFRLISLLPSLSLSLAIWVSILSPPWSSSQLAFRRGEAQGAPGGDPGAAIMARRAGTAAETAAPPWLEPLLATTFFASCALHGDAARGECNMFCLDCPSAGAFCFYCRSSAHADHRSIQIRRSSYHDVVRVSEVQKALDVSGVQTYVINSARVVFLNERPQPKGTSASSSGIGGAAKSAAHLCEICSRTLLDPVRFCSLGCKLEGIKRTGGGATFLLLDDDDGGGGGGGAPAPAGQEPTASSAGNRRLPDRRRPADRGQDLSAGHVIPAAKPRRRKGIPRRSPLAS